MNRKILCNFIIKYFKPAIEINTYMTSYGLKHIIEDKIGDYVSNDNFIACMMQCGFKRQLSDTINKRNPMNYYFNITQESINKLKGEEQ